jgi:glutaminyl-peptide cyclotransferase
MRNRMRCWFLLLLVFALLAGCGQGGSDARESPLPPSALSPLPSLTPPLALQSFDGEAAFQHAAQQMALGARPTGSAANRATGDYIVAQLEALGWEVEEQSFAYQGTPVRNIVGRAGQGPVVVLGAHYDTRRRADRDPQDPSALVPGANDGASGVAVLLELARALDKETLSKQVWLAFFDAEDNGNLDGWEWIVGSSHMAQNLTITPEYVIIVDMVGDADQQLYMERNSDPELSARIWGLAAELGYADYFLNSVKHSLLDDHTPFARRGIPAVDIIDFDYPHWHTTADTLDKISPLSLERVGRVLETLLEKQR